MNDDVRLWKSELLVVSSVQHWAIDYMLDVLPK